MKLRIVAIAATVLLLAGCSAEPNVPTVAATSVATPTPTSPTPTWTAKPWPTDVPSTAEAPPVVETPAEASDPSQEDETFLATIGEIDPGLAHERSLNRAANVCLDIEQGKDNMTVITSMEARFEGGTVPNLDGGQLAMLLSAIETTCD
jgi:PBP1b-binding outer membrane lipoprotein LpoB